MILRRLELLGFRSYHAAACSFDPGINVIAGLNAQGKTNLLEGVYYLASARSFRTRTDKELIRMDEDQAAVRGELISGDREQLIDIYLSRRERKKIFVNGVKQKTAAGLSGRFCCVLFSPDDLELVRSGAAARRRYMDLAISQLRPQYAETRAEFNRVYAEKSRILKDWRERPDLLEVLDDYSLSMARLGSTLIRYRAAWCRRAAEAAQRLHREISGRDERLRAGYVTVSSLEDPLGLSQSQILDGLLAHQERHRQAELDSGQCLSGAHKDDISLEIGGMNAGKFASQGQARTAALALKLAEWEIARDDLGESPVLLLDDVLSELDSLRQDYVLNSIGGGQVFITCCASEEVRRKTGGRVIYVENGTLRPGEAGKEG